MLQTIDPEGVADRKKRYLKRRLYYDKVSVHNHY